MSPLALQACQACGTSLAGVPVTQTENATWHWHRCCCRCKRLPANIICAVNIYLIGRCGRAAEVMMGFIFGVERTLKLPLMISLRRPDRTGSRQHGPLVIQGSPRLRIPHFIWHHMDSYGPSQSFPSFPFQANEQCHCFWWPACHASWLSDALPVFWFLSPAKPWRSQLRSWDH